MHDLPRQRGSRVPSRPAPLRNEDGESIGGRAVVHLAVIQPLASRRVVIQIELTHRNLAQADRGSELRRQGLPWRRQGPEQQVGRGRKCTGGPGQSHGAKEGQGSIRRTQPRRTAISRRSSTSEAADKVDAPARRQRDDVAAAWVAQRGVHLICHRSRPGRRALWEGAWTKPLQWPPRGTASQGSHNGS